MTIMGIQYLSHVESRRSNLAREGEAVRHNVATETLGALSHGEVVRSNLVKERVSMGNLDELVRSNRARESLTSRQLTELERSNLAHEYLGQQNVNIGWGQLSETSRSNRQREALGFATLSESSRHNVAQESLGRGNLAQLTSFQTASLAENKTKNRYDVLAKTAPGTAGGLALKDLDVKGRTGPLSKVTSKGEFLMNSLGTLAGFVKGK